MRRGTGIEQTGAPRVFAREGVAKGLFAVLRPRDAGAASLGDGALELRGPLGSREISVADIGAVDLESRWGWGRVRVRAGHGAPMVMSGLSKRKAADVAAAVREAREREWQRALATHRSAIESMDKRLAAFTRPTSYVRQRAFAALVEDIRTAAAGLPRQRPRWLPRTPESQSIKRIRAFLAEPEAFRGRANEGFLADELERSRVFLDSVETRPLKRRNNAARCAWTTTATWSSPPPVAARRP